jgi:hypothetical protein
MVFLKILTSLHTRLAAETHYQTELLQVAADTECLELRGRSGMPVASVKGWATEIKK